MRNNDVLSDQLPVLSGVPQGSILGPLLFFVYINDLPLSVRYAQSLIFADDTKCYHSIMHPRDSNLLQLDLDSLHDWSTMWNLKFQGKKCVHVRFSTSSHAPVSYRLDDHVIESRSTHRDLGVTLCHDLSWDHHCDVISAKAYRCLGLLRRTFCSANCISTKKELYLTLVCSKVMYCSQLWCPHKLKDVRKLEAIQ